MKILKECYQEALDLLSANREVMDKLADFLIERETITGKEFMRIYREIKGLPQPAEEAEQHGGYKSQTAAGDKTEGTERTAAEGKTEAELNAEPAQKTEAELNAESEQKAEAELNAEPEQKTEAEQNVEPEEKNGSDQKPEKERWVPPTPGPEYQNKGPVGRFSGASWPKDDEQE